MIKANEQIKLQKKKTENKTSTQTITSTHEFPCYKQKQTRRYHFNVIQV